MTVAAKLGGFAVGLLVVFATAAFAGGAFDPSPPQSSSQETHMNTEMAMHDVRGLAVAEDGLKLVVANPEHVPGRMQQLRFRIVDDKGVTVRDFDVEHTKRMHLIVVRRDLTGFQHLHPVQADDGSWSVPLLLDTPGSYRVFADFSHDEQPETLASDLRVSGPAELQPLPAPADVATSGTGYAVRLARTRARAGQQTELKFTVRRNGRPVAVEPYLGALGHLVALREGDLAFLHVHPTAGVRFESTFPTSGRYRLFLQFKHEGRVHTAAFTEVVS